MSEQSNSKSVILAPKEGATAPNSLHYQRTAPHRTCTLCHSSNTDCNDDLMVCHYNRGRAEETTLREETFCLDCDHFTSLLKPPKRRRLQKNEHLIGVEENPGPVLRIDDVSNGSKSVVLHTTQQKKKKNKGLSLQANNRQQQQRSNGGRQIGPITSAYMKMLCDPTDNPPVPSGFMTWTPTFMQSPYVKGTALISSDGYVFTVNPDASLSPANGNTANTYLGSYVTVANYSGNVISGIAQSLYAANRQSILSGCRTNRVCAGGMKIVVEHPSTSQSGIISVTRLNGMSAATDLDPYYPAAYQVLPATEIYTTHGGTATVKVNWLPSDPTDFAFSKNDVYSNGEGVYNPVVIALSGFPAGSRIFYEVFTHLECQAGASILGSVVANSLQAAGTISAALIDEHPSPDAFLRKASALITHASRAVEYTAEKATLIDDVISRGTALWNGVGKIAGKAAGLYNTVGRSRVGGALLKLL